jgi:hypothetical protein
MRFSPRPPFLIFIALSGILGVAGIAAFMGVGIFSRQDEGVVTLLVVASVFALFRLATVIGLLRLRPWARIVEQVYNGIQVVLLGVAGLAGAVLNWRVGLPVLWLAIFALVVVLYLRRAEIRLLFSRGIEDLAEEERAAELTRLQRTSMAQWAIMLLTIISFAGFTLQASSNLSEAVQRSKQKRTMAEMRTIATAWEARATDLNRYNAAGAVTLPGVAVSAEEVNRHLAPRYIKRVPALDAWGRPYTFHLDVAFAGSRIAENYAIRSFGRDGKASPLVAGSTSDYDCDIVFSNGSFVVFPEGRSN